MNKRLRTIENSTQIINSNSMHAGEPSGNTVFAQFLIFSPTIILKLFDKKSNFHVIVYDSQSTNNPHAQNTRREKSLYYNFHEHMKFI